VGAPQETPRRSWIDFVPWHRGRAAKLLRDATVEAQRSRLPQMAAALSYRTIFGLIPVIVVALIALKAFTTDSDLADGINRALQYSGLAQIAVEDSPANMGPFPEGEGPPAAASQGAQRLDQWIKELVARVGDLKLRVVGWIGVIALLYAAISMLVEVERAFNQIYCVPVGRSWVRRVLNYWALLTLGAGALFATFYVGQRFQNEVVSWAARAGVNSSSAVFLAVLGYLTTTSISTVLFLLVYMAIPNTRVQIRSALVGAFVAALLWEAGKWGFTQYLRYSTGYARLYGSIALVPLFLLWVYFTWCIVLAGLNIAYYLQHGRRKGVARPVEQINPGVVDPGSAVALACVMARRFEKGEPSDAGTLAGQLNLQEGIVVQMLDRFVQSGIALRCKHRNDDGYFALARPADRLSAEEVLSVGEELIAQPADGTVAGAMRESRGQVVRGKTVADFLGERPSPSAPAPPALAGPARA
jgi:membrane protein